MKTTKISGASLALCVAMILVAWTSSIAATPAGLLRVEGASPTQHNWTGISANDPSSLELRECMECPDGGGYRAAYEFSVPTAGTYTLWLVGTPPAAGWTSPIQLTLNGKRLEFAPKNLGPLPGRGELNAWVRLTNVRLNAGTNDLVVVILHRRQFPDNEFCFYIDEFIFAPTSWTFSSKSPLTLPTPLNSAKATKSSFAFAVDAAAQGPTFPATRWSLAQGASMWTRGFLQNVTPQIKQFKPAYFRKDNFVPACTRDGATWRYDFSELDRGVAEIRATTAEVIACIEPSGPAIADIPAGQSMNLAGWEDYCYQIAKHFSAADHPNRIHLWEVLNEPDGRSFYTKDYVAIFAAAARGIHRADPTAKVGGPASVGPNEVIPFIKKCLVADVKPDFVSYHHYGVSGDEFVNTAVSIRKQSRQLLNNPTLPLFVTEWGITSACCKYWWNSAAAAFNTSVYAAMERRPGCPDIATQFMVKDLVGNPSTRFGLFDENDRPYSSYYAAELFWTMQGRRLAVTGDCSDTLDAIAVRDGDTLKVCFWSLQSEGASRQTVVLKVANLPKSATRWRRAVIDPYSSNLYNLRHIQPTTNALTHTPWQPIDVSSELKFEIVPPSVTAIEISQ